MDFKPEWRSEGEKRHYRGLVDSLDAQPVANVNLGGIGIHTRRIVPHPEATKLCPEYHEKSPEKGMCYVTGREVCKTQCKNYSSCIAYGRR